jgi:hypothetical protein
MMKLWYYPYTQSFDYVRGAGKSWDRSVDKVSMLRAGPPVSDTGKDFLHKSIQA